jgi:hypothetical protein
MFKCSGKVGEWGGSKSPPNPWDFGNSLYDSYERYRH